MNIAFDVDGTLFTAGSVVVPRTPVIEILKELHKAGHTIIVWSGGGTQYAMQQIRNLYIQNYVDQYLPKFKNDSIDICFDDQDVTLAKVNIRI